ncbi:hypothetical protein ACD661_01040 [Legionella lytica]|uniref:Uncharacterized protein n=1 Tax=Legionella lytica TaxID=96232 RepID=A0ABW8D4I8_9GAMM
MSRETSPLLTINHSAHDQDNSPAPKESLTRGIALTKAFPDGMGKTYATFGPIAVLYRQGLWLLAPVLIGGTISISDEAFSLLKERYPDNTLITQMAKMTKGTNQVLVGFLEDFGFTMGMLTTIAVQIGGIQYSSNAFGKIIAPLVSILPAGLIRYIRNRHAAGQHNSLPLEITANTVRAANSPTFVLGLLQQQGILDEQSKIPGYGILGAGIIGLMAGLLNKSHPKIAHVLNALMETILENPSLAVAFFAFPNDIYAAQNGDEISEGFFFSNVAVSSIYLIMLTMFSLMIARHEWRELTHSDEVIEYVESQSDIENQLMIPDSNTDTEQLAYFADEEGQPTTKPSRSHSLGFFDKTTSGTESSININPLTPV